MPNCTQETPNHKIEFGRPGRRVVEGQFDGGSMTGDAGVMLLAKSQGQVLYCNILLLHACLKTRVFKPEITTELLCNGLLECLWRRFLHVFPKTSLVSGTTATYAHCLTHLVAAPVQPGDTEA